MSTKRFGKVTLLQRVIDIGLQVTELAAAIVANPFKRNGVDSLVTHQICDRVGKLNLTPCTFASRFKLVSR